MGGHLVGLVEAHEHAPGVLQAGYVDLMRGDLLPVLGDLVVDAFKGCLAGHYRFLLGATAPALITVS